MYFPDARYEVFTSSQEIYLTVCGQNDRMGCSMQLIFTRRTTPFFPTPYLEAPIGEYFIYIIDLLRSFGIKYLRLKTAIR